MCLSGGITPKIHLSVIGRIALGTEGYSPGNLPNHIKVVSNAHPEIAAAATEHLKDESPRLLPDTSTLILLRRVCHSVVVFLTLFMLGCVVWYTMQPVTSSELITWNGAVNAGRNLSSLGSWAGIWKGVESLAIRQWWSIATLALVLTLTWRLRLRQERVYAEFWYKRRRALRRLFEAPAKAGAAGL
jgi:hypothetical protein